jgi:hypothetical protein
VLWREWLRVVASKLFGHRTVGEASDARTGHHRQQPSLVAAKGGERGHRDERPNQHGAGSCSCRYPLVLGAAFAYVVRQRAAPHAWGYKPSSDRHCDTCRPRCHPQRTTPVPRSARRAARPGYDCPVGNVVNASVEDFGLAGTLAQPIHVLANVIRSFGRNSTLCTLALVRE